MRLDKKERQFLLRSILDHQRCFTLLAAYDAELVNRFGRDWLFALKNKVESLIEHPAAKEAAGQHFADLIKFVLEGLDEQSAQEIMDWASNPRLAQTRRVLN